MIPNVIRDDTEVTTNCRICKSPFVKRADEGTSECYVCYRAKWERKTIPLDDVVIEQYNSMEQILEKHRDWMLGGEHFEWRYFKEPTTGNIILERR